MAVRKILDHIDHIVVHMIDRIAVVGHTAVVVDCIVVVHIVAVDQTAVLDQIVAVVVAFAAVRSPFVDYKLLLYFGTKQFPYKGTTNHLSIRRSLRIQSTKNRNLIVFFYYFHVICGYL